MANKKESLKIAVIYLLANAEEFSGLLDKEAKYYRVGGRSTGSIAESSPYNLVYGRILDILEKRIKDDNFFGWYRSGTEHAGMSDNLKISVITDGKKITAPIIFKEETLSFEPVVEKVDKGDFFEILSERKSFKLLTSATSNMEEEEKEKVIEILFPEKEE
ncbi:MAG: hypothetical protein PF542_05475 [Nanoarchaeota archaeon]|jgi:hypothetical protein|nr:hypothetical protein [Nanoarchaeota archaeon]